MSEWIHGVPKPSRVGDSAGPGVPSTAGFAGAALARLGASGGESRHGQVETVWVAQSGRSVAGPKQPPTPALSPRLDPLKRVPKFPQHKRVGIGTGCATGSSARVRTVQKLSARRGRTGTMARVQTVRYLPGQRRRRRRREQQEDAQ